MTVKRRLTRIRLDKIAAVDRPCQEHATLAIIKRAPQPDAPSALIKRTFEEALNAQLVGERISEVFWRAFDKSYAAREAFREALADELAAGGDGSVATDGFTAAMRTIAETAATLAREAGAQADTDLESAVEQAVEKWLKQQETDTMKITTKAALSAAVAGFAIAKSSLADANDIVDAAITLDALDAIPADSPLAPMLAAKQATSGNDTVVKGLQKQVAVLSLTGDIRKHYDALPADKQDAFLALSSADQASAVEKANATDPVLYTTAGGIEIRKSDGTAAAMLAKQLDETAAELVVLKAGRTEDTLEKRASTEFPNVAKATAVAMLKTAGQLGETTDAGKDVIKSLQAMNKGAAGLMKSIGSTETPVSGDIQKARTDFNTEVSKVMREDKIGMADAMSKVRTEQPALFAEAFPQTVEMDADEA